MILSRQMIRNRDRLSTSKVVDVPELGEGAEVRLCPIPASVQLMFATLGEEERATKGFTLMIAGALCDEAGARLYTTSAEDLQAIADDMPWPALVKIAQAAMEVSGLTEKSAEALEKN